MVDDQHALEHKLAARKADYQQKSGSPDFVLLPSSAVKCPNDYIGEDEYKAHGRKRNCTNLPKTLAIVVDSNGTIANSSMQEPNHHREPLTTIFPTSKKAVKVPLISQQKFRWDQTEQGHILGAFFYGYILFQIPGARMAEAMGAKWIIMAASAGSALISLAFPLSTQLNSIYLLMVLRFVMGLCQSAFFPAAYVLFCRWLPEKERSVLLPVMFVGSNMGSISTYILSSYLISSDYGWPSVFYFSGIICLIASILWGIFGSNEPSDNWLITDKERDFIEHQISRASSDNEIVELGTSEFSKGEKIRRNSFSIQQQSFRNQKSQNLDTCVLQAKMNQAKKHEEVAKMSSPEPSWPKLIKSIPIWTLILSMYGNEWSNVVLCYELPTYLNTALNLPIEQNGVINSFFQLSYAVAAPVMSSLGTYVLSRHLLNMKKIHVRKLFQSMALFGQLICFASVPFCDSNKGLIITIMFSATVVRACSSAGDLMVSGDLSPEYAGTIFAFANSVGNTAGFFVPLLAGFFVENAYNKHEWTPFWLTTAAIMGLSGLIFLFLGETSRQDFTKSAKPSVKEIEALRCQDQLPILPLNLRADCCSGQFNANGG